jgi:hypothetical protein
MAKHLDDDAVKAVRNVKNAIAQSQRRLDEAGLAVSKVQLALETALTWEAGVGFKIKIIDLEATHTHASSQTLTLDLTPGPQLEGLGPSLAEELEQAIVATAAATREAAATEPRFGLDEASVALQVAISNDGKVAVFVSGGGEKTTTHTLTVTLQPKS